MKRPTLVPLVRLKEYQPAMVLWVAATVLAGARCSAQAWGTVEFSPVAGAYLSTAELPYGCFHVALPNPCTPPKQSTTVAVGGRLTAWLSRGIAVEGSLWDSPSSPANVVAGSARLLLGLTPRSGTRVYIVGGPAFVRLFGYDYASSIAGIDLGSVVAVGAHVRVAPSLALRTELEQYVYSYAEHRQRDLFLSLGLSLAPRIRLNSAAVGSP